LEADAELEELRRFVLRNWKVLAPVKLKGPLSFQLALNPTRSGLDGARTRLHHAAIQETAKRAADAGQPAYAGFISMSPWFRNTRSGNSPVGFLRNLATSAVAVALDASPRYQVRPAACRRILPRFSPLTPSRHGALCAGPFGSGLPASRARPIAADGHPRRERLYLPLTIYRAKTGSVRLDAGGSTRFRTWLV
jgi:hypothetical protein